MCLIIFVAGKLRKWIHFHTLQLSHDMYVEMVWLVVLSLDQYVDTFQNQMEHHLHSLVCLFLHRVKDSIWIHFSNSWTIKVCQPHIHPLEIQVAIVSTLSWTFGAKKVLHGELKKKWKEWDQTINTAHHAKCIPFQILPWKLEMTNFLTCCHFSTCHPCTRSNSHARNITILSTMPIHTLQITWSCWHCKQFLQ